jgi:hypothetical protein
MAIHDPERLDRLVLNTTAGIRFAPGVVPERPKEGREALAARSLQAISAPTAETIRKRLEWLMAAPSRVTDELVDVRMKLYADPDVQQSLRSVFQNAFGGVGAPRKLIPEEQLADVRTPTLVLWSDNPGTDRRSGATSRTTSSGALRLVRMALAAVGAPRDPRHLRHGVLRPAHGRGDAA